MLWIWIAGGVAVWLIAALAVSLIIGKAVKLRDELERPRPRVEHSGFTSSKHGSRANSA